jgi:hypothetical protein
VSAAWVAVSVRAAGMRRRRVGAAAIRELAASPSLDAALNMVSNGPYGHDVRAGQSLAQAQRAAVATFVWNVRVLAGWAPRGGVALLRALVAPIEVINIEEQLRPSTGGGPVPPYRLGALATAWSRLARTSDPDGLRLELAHSPWGDPGSDDPHAISVALRLSLARRISIEVPAAGRWAAGAAALVLARELAFCPGSSTEQIRFLASEVVGPNAAVAGSLAELRSGLPVAARWALGDVDAPDGLWRAEAAWWGRVDRAAVTLARHGRGEAEALTGTVAMLAVDAWRVRAALELAARGGGTTEDLDALA